MKNIFWLLFFVPFLVFQACTTDAGYDPSSRYIDKKVDYYIEDGYEMPKCNKSSEGTVFFVENDLSVYACIDSVWTFCRKITADALVELEDALPYDKSIGIGKESENKEKIDIPYETSSIVDSRDGHKYKTVIVDDMEWMAENLDYETDYSLTSPECEARGINCGQFYNWRDAVSGGEDYSEICPDGFRLPEQADAEHLANFVGGLPHVLKSKDYWDTEDLRGGTDEIGFNAIPAGFSYSGYPSFHDFGYSAHFWSSEYAKDSYRSAYEIVLYSFYDYIDWYLTDQDNYYNVRCMRVL